MKTKHLAFLAFTVGIGFTFAQNTSPSITEFVNCEISNPQTYKKYYPKPDLQVSLKCKVTRQTQENGRFYDTTVAPVEAFSGKIPVLNIPLVSPRFGLFENQEPILVRKVVDAHIPTRSRSLAEHHTKTTYEYTYGEGIQEFSSSLNVYLASVWNISLGHFSASAEYLGLGKKNISETMLPIVDSMARSLGYTWDQDYREKMPVSKHFWRIRGKSFANLTDDKGNIKEGLELYVISFVFQRNGSNLEEFKKSFSEIKYDNSDALDSVTKTN